MVYAIMAICAIGMVYFIANWIWWMCKREKDEEDSDDDKVHDPKTMKKSEVKPIFSANPS